MIRWSKMNEWVHDITPNRMQLDVSASLMKYKFKKMQQLFNFNQLD